MDPSLSQITANIWTGGALRSYDDIFIVAKLGITAIEDERDEFDDIDLVDFYNAHHYDEHDPTFIHYLYNPVEDDGQPKPVSWFKKSWDWAEGLLQRGHVVLVHCHDGRNRGPSKVYFLIRAWYGMSRDETVDLIHSRRPETNEDHSLRYIDDADEALVVLDLLNTKPKSQSFDGPARGY
jgi:hypothetical protein